MFRGKSKCRLKPLLEKDEDAGAHPGHKRCAIDRGRLPLGRLLQRARNLQGRSYLRRLHGLLPDRGTRQEDRLDDSARGGPGHRRHGQAGGIAAGRGVGSQRERLQNAVAELANDNTAPLPARSGQPSPKRKSRLRRWPRRRRCGTSSSSKLARWCSSPTGTSSARAWKH